MQDENNQPIPQTPQAPISDVPPPVENKSRKKRLAIAAAVAIAVLVIAAAGIIAFQRKNAAFTVIKDTNVTKEPAEEDSDEFKYEAVVAITSEGFVPATIEVKPDTRILFENKDTEAHSVDPTPGGDIEQFFASKGNIEPAGGYGHSFETPGTYNYHDATHPSFNGVVIVR